MPNVTVAAGEVASGRITLTANAVSVVTFAENVREIEIVSDGTAAIYYTIDGSTPTVDGRNTYELPSGGPWSDTQSMPGESDVVKLISAGAPTVRVTRRQNW